MVDRRPEDMVRITTPELAQAFIDEQVIEVFRNQMDANLIYVDAVDRFLDKLAGVDDPEDMNFELVEPVRILFKDEVPGINRVLYDFTPKPTGTVEIE